MDSDIAAFLEARYAEEDAIANGLYVAARIPDKVPDFFAAGGPAAEQFWNCFDAARVLRQVAAGRARLDGHAPTDLEAEFGADTVAAFSRAHGEPASRCQTCRVPYPCRTLRIDAGVYAGHPDYKETWKP